MHFFKNWLHHPADPPSLSYPRLPAILQAASAKVPCEALTPLVPFTPWVAFSLSAVRDQVFTSVASLMIVSPSAGFIVRRARTHFYFSGVVDDCFRPLRVSLSAVRYRVFTSVASLMIVAPSAGFIIRRARTHFYFTATLNQPRADGLPHHPCSENSYSHSFPLSTSAGRRLTLRLSRVSFASVGSNRFLGKHANH
jgi:hypothetical protein